MLQDRLLRDAPQHEADVNRSEFSVSFFVGLTKRKLPRICFLIAIIRADGLSDS